MSSPLYAHKKRFSLFGILILLIVLVSGLSALIFLNESQDTRQQAWVGSSDVQDSCINGNCEEKKTLSDLFTSPQKVYEVNLKNSLWKQAEVPSTVSSKSTDPSFFIFRNDLGFATIFLNSVPLEKEYLNLDVIGLAQVLEKQIQAEKGTSVSYVGKEIVNLGEKTGIRFDFTETLLGKKTVYSEYVLPSKAHYIEAEVRSVGTPVIQVQIESFLNGLRFIEETGVVKGVSTESVTFAESEITELVKPSVAHVLHLYCKNLQVASSIPTVYLQRSYPFCSGGYGSGFVVDGSGLVATNGHVVASHPEQDIIGGLTSGDPAIATFVIDFVREILGGQGLATTPEEGFAVTSRMMQDPSGVQAIVQSIYELLDTQTIMVTPTSEKYFVNLGTEPFEFTAKELTPANIDTFVKEKTALFSADLAGADFANLFSKGVVFDKQKPVGSDVALLQVNGTEGYTYPSLHIGNAETLKEGDAVLVLGFPGAVAGSEEDLTLLDYASSSTKVTVTRGIVSSIKKDSQGNTLIQTDATIGHGNSGGPAFNSQGQVVGIATYGMGDEVGNFNFLRDVADLQRLAEKQNLALKPNASDTYVNWETALGYYWQNRYTKSLSFLNKVEESYPVHPTAEKVVEDAKKAIEEGKDIDLIFGMPKSTVFMVGAVIGLLIIGGVVFIILKKKKSTSLVAEVPVVPQPEMVAFDQAPLQPPVSSASFSSQPETLPQKPIAQTTESAVLPPVEPPVQPPVVPPNTEV